MKGSVIRSTIIAAVLVFGGMYTQYHYGVLERYFNQTPLVNRQGNTSQIGNLLNKEVPTNKNVDFSDFWEVWALLERDYIEPDKIEAEKLVNGAIAGMTSAVGDPYTMYLPPDDNQRSAEDLAGAFFGVGIELGYIENTLAVIAPLKGTPADAAGLQAGDLILRVKDEAKDLDEDTTGWNLSQAVSNIRGPKGTPVTLTLLRRDNGMEPFEVSLNRGEIVVKSVEVEYVEHKGKRAAHVQLSRFGDRTKQEWEEVVQNILSQRNSVDIILLDMRNNPGGYFDGAIDVASEFIPKGVIVSQKGRFTNQDFSAKGRARLKDIPVEVLVNRGSASASEIVAGAMRDQLGSKLIGENTFGKGTVQDRRELNNGGGIHITVSRWLLPKGSWIHEEGLPVDVEVKDDPETEQDEVVLKAIELL